MLSACLQDLSWDKTPKNGKAETTTAAYVVEAFAAREYP